ncbi:MAG TPA: TadE/TadG family type IV pilus assembly protein [Acidimicrobiales bacterium]|nr:TadE/TadG family type IV pilus assembly protein [Acidimicrobiales bacterium]
MTRPDRGQAAVELALVMPLVMVLLLGLVQLGLVIRDQVLVVHAAREAVREAAVSDDRRPPTVAAAGRSGLDARRLSVTIRGQRRGSGTVEVRLRYRASTEVPFIGPLLPDVVLHAHAAMRRESGS